MKDKTAFYFYGNWKAINGYLGEPQKTLQLLIGYLKEQSNIVEILGDIGEVQKIKNGNYKVLIFGDLPTISIRTFLCLISGVSFAKIHFILFKEKMTFSDISFFLKNIDSLKRVRYLNNVSLLEIFLPQKLLYYFFSLNRKKIFAAFFPTSTVDKSRVFLCSCLEENYLRQFVTLSNRKFDRKKIELLYFGRDSYLRGVDVIKELNEIDKEYTISCTGIFPFKGFLSQEGLQYPYYMYDNNKNILEKVKEATFTLFPFRARFAGPDVPAALVESFLLGVPPIISEVLLFDVLKKHKYPLVIDRISAGSIKKCLQENIKNEKDYEDIVNLCHLISKDIVSKYSYSFEKINV